MSYKNPLGNVALAIWNTDVPNRSPLWVARAVTRTTGVIAHLIWAAMALCGSKEVAPVGYQIKEARYWATTALPEDLYE